MKNHFVFAKLSNIDCLGVRIGGAGLGNILFPWSRAIVYAEKNNLPKINTTWHSIKIGPFLRGELDTRGYNNLFYETNISGIRKFFLLLFGKRIMESDAKEYELDKSIGPKILIFSGMGNQMQDILHDNEIVKKELINITNKEILDQVESFDGKGVSIHIRMGDFYIPKSEDEIRNGKKNCRLPIEWYVKMIDKIRSYSGKELQVNIFSDGSEDDLKDILSINNVKRHYYGSAIADMLAISKSEILIASNSTFSLWASYLGRMPTIWFPGTHRFKLFVESNEIFENTIDYSSELPPLLKDNIDRIL